MEHKDVPNLTQKTVAFCIWIWYNDPTETPQLEIPKKTRFCSWNLGSQLGQSAYNMQPRGLGLEATKFVKFVPEIQYYSRWTLQCDAKALYQQIWKPKKAKNQIFFCKSREFTIKLGPLMTWYFFAFILLFQIPSSAVLRGWWKSVLPYFLTRLNFLDTQFGRILEN